MRERLKSIPFTLVIGCAMLMSSWAQGQSPRPEDRSASAKSPLELLLHTQTEAWNKGDLDGFMDGYWRSEQLTMSSGGTTRRGWQAIHDRYQERYGGKQDLGKLTFSDLEVTMLAEEHALILGTWHLLHEGATMTGNFSLVLRRFGEDWRIIHDHTSSLVGK